MNKGINSNVSGLCIAAVEVCGILLFLQNRDFPGADLVKCTRGWIKLNKILELLFK